MIEMRASEQSGGRTGQESLLDKYRVILDWIIGKSHQPLVNKRIKVLHMVIVTLYSQDDYRLLSRDNMNMSRLNSLVSYVIENLGDKFKQLINQGFTSTWGNNIESYHEKFSKGERLELTRDNFKITFSIITGQEFFKSILGMSYQELNAKFKDLGDDLWLTISILPYELRYYYQFGFMWSKKIYDVINDSKSPICLKSLLGKYGVNEDKIIEEIVNYLIRTESELKLLETNNIHTQYDYLRKLVGIAILMCLYNCPQFFVM